MYKIGDIIKVKRFKNSIKPEGYSKIKDISKSYITEEEITDIFDSMDKTFKCFYIKGSTELIAEHSLVI